MGSSILSEVDDTSILRTGLSTCYWHSLDWLPASRLLPPRSGLERSDFVSWAQVAEKDVRSNVGYWGVKRTRFARNEFCRWLPSAEPFTSRRASDRLFMTMRDE